MSYHTQLSDRPQFSPSLDKMFYGKFIKQRHLKGTGAAYTCIPVVKYFETSGKCSIVPPSSIHHHMLSALMNQVKPSREKTNMTAHSDRIIKNGQDITFMKNIKELPHKHSEVS